MPNDKAYGFDARSASRISRAVRTVEGQATDLRGKPLTRRSNLPLGTTFAVKLSAPVSGGGSNGTQTTKATYTYVVKDLNGNVLDGTDAAPLQPLKPREKGALVGRATRGQAFWDENGDLVLDLAHEEYDTGACG